MIHHLEAGEVIGFISLKGVYKGQETTGSFPVMKGETRGQAERNAIRMFNQMEGCSGWKVVPDPNPKKETAKQRNERLGNGRRNR